MSTSNMELRKKRSKKPKVSASHWVGYVDDAETPEMIMKKFEMLERIQKETVPAKPAEEDAQKPMEVDTAPPTDSPAAPAKTEQPGVLSDAQLEKMFKLTSMFVVPDGTGAVYDIGEDMFDDDAIDDLAADIDELEENFWTVNDEGELVSAPKPSGAKRERRKRDKRTPSGLDKPSKTKLLSMEVVGLDGYTYTIRKKVKVNDPLEPVYVRVPPLPLPLTWARTIQPYSIPDLEPPGSTYIETETVTKFDLQSLGKQFIGALIDAPWILPNMTDTHHRVVAEDVYPMRLDLVMDVGFVFAWAEKEAIASCVKLMQRWGFIYVENLAWVKQNVNHKFVKEDYPYFWKSKCNLLIFRKQIQGGDGITLRHQRNPDVCFDHVRLDKYLTEDRPEFVYDMIETLLPDGAYKDDTNSGKFLELWGKHGVRRKGWTSIVQQKTPRTSTAAHPQAPIDVFSGDDLQLLPAPEAPSTHIVIDDL